MDLVDGIEGSLRASEIARDLKLDSLAVMDLLMVLEDKFDVSIPLNMVAEITTVVIVPQPPS